MSAVVTGRVQGVGFRSFVRRLAREHEIVGEVWNRSDGSVELVAAHQDQAQLSLFLNRLRLGPGRVEQVLSGPGPSDLEAVDFEIGFSR